MSTTETVSTSSASSAPSKKSVKRRTSDTPKTSVALKRLWHRFCSDNNVKMPLKAFLRQEKENPEVKALTKDWRDHKRGSLEKVAKAARTKNKGARIALEKAATKQARRKSKSGGGG